MRTAGELLGIYPRRMAERGELSDLASLELDEDATVLARVVRAEKHGYGKSQRAVITVSDGTGQLDLVFFGPRSAWRADRTPVGALGMFAGKVGVFNRRRQLVHPDFQLIGDDTMADARGRPLRRAADPGLSRHEEPASLGARQLGAAGPARCSTRSPDPLPDEVRARHGLPDPRPGDPPDPPAGRPGARGTPRGTG